MKMKILSYPFILFITLLLSYSNFISTVHFHTSAHHNCPVCIYQQLDSFDAIDQTAFEYLSLYSSVHCIIKNFPILLITNPVASRSPPVNS